ncbi:TetR/AcrR family transcriptional regulator [Aquibium sp. ELW1220]|uniref:TetR/AcrR family transcriptional regulator n=1 Tax=Aquibium sp. ELW1220 TaxID=2976766 RepID=UPI0025AFB606|nr:TetR/AcrR family transcriptional regulator [Aquibium sp. ELW1220]MDN2580824.1 TetR/AcrR family transcriptional regulator [Aquibium sp. ELW1220]
MNLLKKSYHHRDLRNALQDAAFALIAERNGVAFSLRELGGAVGVSHASVYRHFADKAALLEALTVRGFDLLHAYQQEEISLAGDDAVDRLHALSDAYIRFARENPGAFWLMFGSREESASSAKERERINEEALRTLIEVIVRCQDEGVIVPGDPRRIAGYLIMAPHGYACYSVRDLAMIGLDETLMSARTVSEISLIPVLRHPPSSEAVAARFFGATPNRHDLEEG